MKIAVTSQGDTLDSQLDPRFGRAAYIIVVDTETLEFEALDNNKNKNAFKTLEAAGLKVANDQTGRVIDVIQKFKQGNVIFADGANKDGHW